jgi:hypothetical protein
MLLSQAHATPLEIKRHTAHNAALNGEI